VVSTLKHLKSLVEPDAECKNWTDVYYKGELKDPWKTDLVYELNGNDFTLKSLGNDRREGGAQLNRDIVYGEDSTGSSDKKE
jgi:general secretion pathway protein G